MYYYINNFIIYAILGFIYENILNLITAHQFLDNPLIGPYLPIYGFGVCFMIFLTRLVFNRFKIPRWAKIICLFFLTLIILTVVEQIGGILTETVFHKSFWNYTNFKFNSGKYISLEVSLIWGGACLLFVYLLRPLTDKITKKMPKWLSYLLLGIILVDFIYSFFLK